MTFIGGLIAVQTLALTIFLLYKKYTASLTLFSMGVFMLLVSHFLGINPSQENQQELIILNIFSKIVNTFSSRTGGTGLLIMLIGGYVEYMRRIKASDVFVYISMQPLSVLKKYPYLAAIIVIPIGQFLFLAIPSAVGLGLLLITSVYPILLGLGVSKLTALSVISACTVFDLGITSSNTLVAAGILNIDIMVYFAYQLKITLPLIFLMLLLYYIVNKKFDESYTPENKKHPQSVDITKWDKKVPLYYGLLPLLPLLFTILFSKYTLFTATNTYLNASTAIIVSLSIAGFCELFRRKNLKDVFTTMNTFWHGMSRTFVMVVVLLVAADIFSQGLVQIGFVDAMLRTSQLFGFGEKSIVFLLSLTSFFSALITGSGVASFTTIGQLIPDIALKMNVQPLSLMLPVQLVTGLGRSASPIAIVIIAISEIAGVSPIELAKRNIIPIIILAILLTLLTMITT